MILNIFFLWTRLLCAATHYTEHRFSIHFVFLYVLFHVSCTITLNHSCVYICATGQCVLVSFYSAPDHIGGILVYNISVCL